MKAQTWQAHNGQYVYCTDKAITFVSFSYPQLAFNIRESVDSLCRDGADTQYMQYLSKSRITDDENLGIFCATYLHGTVFALR